MTGIGRVEIRYLAVLKEHKFLSTRFSPRKTGNCRYFDEVCGFLQFVIAFITSSTLETVTMQSAPKRAHEEMRLAMNTRAFRDLTTY